jgi:hypothetical protein
MRRERGESFPPPPDGPIGFPTKSKQEVMGDYWREVGEEDVVFFLFFLPVSTNSRPAQKEKSPLKRRREEGEEEEDYLNSNPILFARIE